MIGEKDELKGGRRFQREGAITAKDLDMAIVLQDDSRHSVT